MDLIKTFFGFLFIAFSAHLYADVISLRTDLWCPYACDPKSDKPGFMIEIAREIFEKHGHTIDYDVLNWARAIDEVKMGKYAGLVGCSKFSSESDGLEFPNIANGVNTNFYWTLKESHWFFESADSLKNKKIGIVKSYSYGTSTDNLIKLNHKAFINVTGQMPLLRMIQMTESKRLDGFLENPNVLARSLKINNKDPELFRVASANVSDQTELFIAFSAAHAKSKLYAKLLDVGMVELRKSGRLKVILERYGMSDWKK